ncbi:MAG TPA: tRNA (N6-isopentenyl adenosine(37)-C2)-methylthiotransferase MiaB [Thermoanaerobaculia bacterium]|jgi:tRNA-2-methylthio-N6-dimethylallyladenosine synthase|nr:tRNA (N6-isopentenyl adenosine(37)-C2)-methylthiotransferase MiaB [Thermoanaerobaculia bacterium]
MEVSRRPRRFFVETWGCQMNELDSQRLAGQLMQQGILPTREPGEADVILLNSCSVREKAEQKVYSRLGEYRLLKRDGRELVIGLCGCVAQQEGERALARVPDLDFVLGPARVGELQDVLARRRAGERVVATGFPQERTYDVDAVSRHGEYKGMVTLIEGCNKNCTFCIVPQTRGPERSRPLAEVVREVRHLLDYGFQEIELLGQTVNHWREPGGDLDFADLLEEVAALPGLERLRFVTSYPRDFTPRMVEQVGKHANICPYLHLPVQSGADAVLRRMGRGYTRREYLDLVAQLRRARPDLALSTDLIVGFPGETEEEFRLTLELVEEVGFSVIYAFKYSPRPGTAAPRLGGAVDDAEASERLQRLFVLQEGIQRRINTELVGKDFDVIVTGWGKQPGTQTGRTPCHRVIHFAAGSEPVSLGGRTRVQVEEAFAYSLLGRRLDVPVAS